MIRIDVQFTGTVPRFQRREWGKVKKTGFEAIARSWHQKMRTKHFTPAGAREYRYSPRDGERGTKGARFFDRSYTGRKLKRHGHTLPLVFSGVSRRLSQLRNISATSKGAKVRMNVPQLNRARRPAGKKSLREELTTVSDREKGTLTRLIARVVRFKIRQWR